MYDATKKQLIDAMIEFMDKYKELCKAQGDQTGIYIAKAKGYKQAIDDIAILLAAL